MQEQFNVLVINDEPGIRISMAGILEDEGHNVIVAEDGYQGIAAAENTNFKIAFIDMRMPWINGIETLDDAAKLEAQAILSKPLDFELILKFLDGNLVRTNILIIDDEPSICEILQKMLQKRGYNVCIATDGHSAIQKAKTKHFDIMFVDVVMPGIDGLQTLKEVKKINPATTVIMMTGKNYDDLQELVDSLGAFAHITKPFDLAKVLQLIINAIKEN